MSEEKIRLRLSFAHVYTTPHVSGDRSGHTIVALSAEIPWIDKERGFGRSDKEQESACLVRQRIEWDPNDIGAAERAEAAGRVWALEGLRRVFMAHFEDLLPVGYP